MCTLTLFSPDSHFYSFSLHPGDIVYVSLAGKPVITLNSLEVARGILERKAGNYSDRPHLHFAKDLAGHGDSVTLMDDTPGLKEQRKIFALEIGNKKALRRFVPLIETQTKDFVRNVLKNPSSDALYDHIRRYVHMRHCYPTCLVTILVQSNSISDPRRCIWIPN